MQLNKVHSDSRGSIDVLVGEELTTCPEVTIFKTKGGMARGGCWHEHSTEHLCVIEGHILYVYKDSKGLLQSKNLYTGNSFTIPPATAHYFVSITDSIVIEFGPQLSEKQAKHEEFRKVVDKINAANLAKL